MTGLAPLIIEPAPLELDSYWNQTFGGMRIAQSWDDLALWEQLLNACPHLTAIVEIGTWDGGMAAFLGAQARIRGLRFATFDVALPPGPVEGFRRLDVFERPDEIARLLKDWSPVLLFCDGGDKPKELRMFGPLLAPADVIAVHDWDDEVCHFDVPSGLAMIFRETCERTASRTRFFMPREEPV